MKQVINPFPVIEDITEVVDVVGGVGDAVEGVVAGAVGGIADALLGRFFESLGDAISGAATKANELVLNTLNSSTTVDLTKLAGNQALQTTTAIGIAMVLAFFFASIVRGLARGEYSALGRAALVDVPLAIVGTLGIVTFAQILLGVTDAATDAVLGDTAATLAEGQLEVFLPAAIASQGLLGGFFAIVYIVAALLTWLWLFLRAALIYFIVVAAPLGIATRAFPPAAVFARRTIEMGIALIVSKFFLALALSVGSEQFASANGDVSQMAVGAATMVLAAFMPSVVLKLIPIAEGATASSGVERAPMRMAAAGVGMAVGGAALMGSIGGAGAAAAGTAGGGTSGGTGSTSSSGSSGSSGGSGSSGAQGSAGTNGANGANGTNASSGDSSVAVVGIASGGVGSVSGSPGETSGSFGDLNS